MIEGILNTPFPKRRLYSVVNVLIIFLNLFLNFDVRIETLLYREPFLILRRDGNLGVRIIFNRIHLDFFYIICFWVNADIKRSPESLGGVGPENRSWILIFSRRVRLLPHMILHIIRRLIEFHD